MANSNANDGLVALLVTAAMLALARPALRGAVVAAAALTKFAPLVLAPLFATYGTPPRRALALTAAGFALVAALALAPVALGDGLGTFYDRTLGFQADRGSPFSVWGLYDLPGRTVALAAALVLAVVVAFVPRRRDPGRRRRARRRGPDRAPARAGALVLPLPRLVPAARARRAALRAQDRLDRLGADGASRARCG